MPSPIDLFAQDTGEGLAHEVTTALIALEGQRAAALLERLRAQFPKHRALAPLALLCDALVEEPPPATSRAVERAAAHIEQALAPAATLLLGAHAARFVGGRWAVLACSPGAQPFDADYPEAFRAALLLRAGDAAAAREAAAGLAQANQHACAQGWLAQATYRLDGPREATQYVFRAVLLAAEGVDALLRALGDEALLRDLRDYRAAADATSQPPPADDLFPAWCLLRHPAASTPAMATDLPDTPAALCLRQVLDLLALERGGVSRALVQGRERLRSLQPWLFESYMATRARTLG